MYNHFRSPFSLQFLAVALSLIFLLPLLPRFSSSCQKDYISTEIRSRHFPAENLQLIPKSQVLTMAWRESLALESQVTSGIWYPFPCSLCSKYSDIYSLPSICQEHSTHPLAIHGSSLTAFRLSFKCHAPLQSFLPTLSELQLPPSILFYSLALTNI